MRWISRITMCALICHVRPGFGKGAHGVGGYGGGSYGGLAHLLTLRSLELVAAGCTPTDLPDGLFLTWAVQSPLQKYFDFPPTQITSILPSSRPKRGAYRDRHGRGMRCGGRGSVGRARGSQGGLISVSGHLAREDDDAVSFFRLRLSFGATCRVGAWGFGTGIPRRSLGKSGE